MNISYLPRRIPRRESKIESDREVADRLRQLADEVESGGGVRGAIIIIDNATPGLDRFRAVPAGNMRESRELAHWALSSIQHRLITQQG